MVAELFKLNLAFRGLSDEDNTEDVGLDGDDLEEDGAKDPASDDADDDDVADTSMMA
jgi:hypothetical protein